MGAPYHYLHRKLEDVLFAFLSGNDDITIANINIYTFMQLVGLGEKVVEPFVGIRCQRSSPTTPEVQLTLGSGSREITAELRVRSHALDISSVAEPLIVVQKHRDFHGYIVGLVMDTFYRADIIDALNTLCKDVGGIEIEQIDQPDINDNPEDRSGVTEITFVFHCHPVA